MFHLWEIEPELKRYEILSLKTQIGCQTEPVEVALEEQGFDRLQMRQRSDRSFGATFSGQTALLRIILMSFIGMTKSSGLLNLALKRNYKYFFIQMLSFTST